MMDGKQLALSLLEEGNTCALVGEGKTLCSKMRGPLACMVGKWRRLSKYVCGG